MDDQISVQTKRKNIYSKKKKSSAYVGELTKFWKSNAPFPFSELSSLRPRDQTWTDRWERNIQTIELFLHSQLAVHSKKKIVSQEAVATLLVELKNMNHSKWVYEYLCKIF